MILDTSMSPSDMAEAPEEIGAKCVEEKPKGEGCVTITVSNDGYKYIRWLQRRMRCICKEPFRPDTTKKGRKLRKALIQMMVCYMM